MKAIIAALALVLLASGPTFAASAHRHFHRDFYVPQYGHYYVPQSTLDAWAGIAGGTNYSTTSREGLIHAF